MSKHQPIGFSMGVENERTDARREAEPVSRDQILTRKQEHGKNYSPCSADHKKDWQPNRFVPSLLYAMTRRLSIAVYRWTGRLMSNHKIQPGV